MERAVSLLGLFVMLALAWLLSENRTRVNLRLIVSGVLLQFLLAVLLLKTRFGEQFFEAARIIVARIVSFSDAGAEMVFGSTFKDHYMAFSVLPTNNFVYNSEDELYIISIIQWVV